MDLKRQNLEMMYLNFYRYIIFSDHVSIFSIDCTLINDKLFKLYRFYSFF